MLAEDTIGPFEPPSGAWRRFLMQLDLQDRLADKLYQQYDETEEILDEYFDEMPGPDEEQQMVLQEEARDNLRDYL